MTFNSLEQGGGPSRASQKGESRCWHRGWGAAGGGATTDLLQSADWGRGAVWAQGVGSSSGPRLHFGFTAAIFRVQREG